MDNTDLLKFRILTCMCETDRSNCTVSAISRILREEKYKISRMMIRMEQEGLVDRSNIRAPALTTKGREQAERYRERFNVAINHLLYEGVDMEHAEKDARFWAIYGSDELMNVVRDSDERYRVKRILKNEKSFDGEVLCETMKDGSYAFPFIFYREQVNGNNNISMANKGFAHPCTLCIENGKGTIRLQVLSMSEKSLISGKYMNGKVNKFEYLKDGRFVSAELHGDMIAFPVNALQFINMGEGAGQILHGSVCVRMQCTVGIAHMPEAKAWFTILI